MMARKRNVHIISGQSMIQGWQKLLGLGFVLLFSCHAYSEIAELDGSERQTLTPYIEYQIENPPFPDEPKRLRPRVGSDTVSVGEFQQLTAASFNLGYTEQRAWLRLRIHNPQQGDQRRYLLTGQRYMRPLIVFERSHPGTFEEIFYNDQHQAFDERPVDNPNLIVPLTFAPDETKELLIYVGAAGAVSLDLALAEPSVIDQENTRSLIMVVFVSGILLSLVVINLMHFFALRRWAYFYYAAMETAVGLFLFHMEGFGFQYLWPNSIDFNMWGTHFLGHGANVLGSLFAVFFLDLIAMHRRLLSVPILMGGVSFLCLMATPIIDVRVSNQIGTFMTSVGPLIYALVGLYVFWKGNKSAAFFVAGWVILGMGNTLFAASVTGLIELPIVSFDWIRLGALGEAILLSWGLSDQVRRLNLEYQRTQEQLLLNLQSRLDDARERLDLEEQVTQGARVVADLDRRLATTSHDVGQPIYALRLSLLALTKEIKDPVVVENLNRALDSMELVLQDNLSNYDAAHATIPSTYGDLFESVSSTLQAEALESNVRIRTVYSKLPIDEENVVPLRRIIQNLVANAVRHSGCRSIVIGLRKTAGVPKVYVLDNGSGLPEDGERSESAGSGLGLSIVKEICEQRDWLMDCRSVRGRGVQFTVTMNV